MKTKLGLAISTLILVGFWYQNCSPLRPSDTQPSEAPPPGPSAITTDTPVGWNDGLTKRCVRTTDPATTLYFEDFTDCPTRARYLQLMTTTNTANGTCAPTGTQAFAINGTTSPAKLNWIRDPAKNNWTAELTLDQIATTHPCGSGSFTSFDLRDVAALGGVPLPRPDRIRMSARASVRGTTVNGSSFQAVKWEGTWDGKSRTVMLAINLETWGDNDFRPEIIDIKNDATSQTISIDGSAYGIYVPIQNRPTDLYIPWDEIIADLVTKGVLERPTSWEQTVTSSVGFSNLIVSPAVTNAIAVTLSVTDYRVYEARQE
ncbi:MAG: hypothetical protein ABL958_05095 [Bdellovibrionia bacterium]